MKIVIIPVQNEALELRKLLTSIVKEVANDVGELGTVEDAAEFSLGSGSPGLSNI